MIRIAFTALLALLGFIVLHAEDHQNSRDLLFPPYESPDPTALVATATSNLTEAVKLLVKAMPPPMTIVVTNTVANQLPAKTSLLRHDASGVERLVYLVDEHPWIVQTATLMIVMVSTLAALLSFLLALRLKRMDVRLACQKRWNEIEFDMRLKAENADTKSKTKYIEAYYRQFWAHQWDQFHYWQDGLLDTRTFMLWMRYRYRDRRAKPGRGYARVVEPVKAEAPETALPDKAEAVEGQTQDSIPVRTSVTESEYLSGVPGERAPDANIFPDDGWDRFGRSYVELDGDKFVEFMTSVFNAQNESQVMNFVVQRRGILPVRAFKCLLGPMRHEWFAHKHRQ